MFPFAHLRRVVLTSAAVLATLAAAYGAVDAAERTVVELFTSQGCSSCPPADQHLTDLAEVPGVVALTYNVDYWDYLGWKDTLATAENTKRQKEYAEKRGDREIYTPQVVIDGRTHVVGSRKGEIDRAIGQRKADPDQSGPSLSIRRDGRELEVLVGASSKPNDDINATVWLMVVEPKVKVDIHKGENLDKTITYTNVVRKMMPVAMWRGEPLRIVLPAGEFALGTEPHGVVLVQDDEGGPIIASTDIVTLQP